MNLIMKRKHPRQYNKQLHQKMLLNTQMKKKNNMKTKEKIIIKNIMNLKKEFFSIVQK